MIENMLNKKYGKLTVIKQYYKIIKDERKRDFCDCLCDCGNIKEGIYGKNIRRGLTISCGKCGLREQRIYDACHKTNIYDLSNDYGIGYDSKGREFYFDIEDYEKIKDYCWNIVKNGYASAGNIYMHNYLMNISGTRRIDHKNRKRNDNRKENLRLSTIQQNNCNREISSSNTSGVIGISKTKDGLWESYLMINGERVHHKKYENFNEAVYYRLLAEKEYFGEFAPQQHLFQEYGIS